MEILHRPSAVEVIAPCVMLRRRFLALSAAAGAAPRSAASTPDDGKTLARFGVIADVQYADADPAGERHFRESLPKLRQAVEDLARENLSFTLHLGDTIDRDHAAFDTILPVFDGLGHPLRNLLGNHDFDVADEHKAGIPARLGMPAAFHSFTHGSLRFVLLDTCEVATYRHPAGSAEAAEARAAMQRMGAAPNAKPWNGGVSHRQLAWLDKELAAADESGQAAIVCGHHPLLPHEMHTAWNHREILNVLEKHPSARAYLCGHNHAGNQTVSPGGIPCVTFKSMLHEPGVTAYSVVRWVDPGFLVIEGRGREASRTVDARPRS